MVESPLEGPSSVIHELDTWGLGPMRVGPYGILQPITKVSGQDDLTHGLDLMWRLSF